MNFADILDPTLWDRLTGELAKRFQVNAFAVNDKGDILRSSGLCNPLCRTVCAHPNASQTVCGQSLKVMAQDAFEEGKGGRGECEAGLDMFLEPVFADGRYAGALAVCGWLDPEGDVDAFLLEEETGIPEDEFEALMPDIRDATPEEQRELLAHLKEAAMKAAAHVASKPKAK